MDAVQFSRKRILKMPPIGAMPLAALARPGLVLHHINR
jgi:hypothetical protein